MNFKKSFFPRNKKGQFFLIAAIIIITVTVGIITVSNYTEEKDSVRLYDLKEELGIESQEVLDHGTYAQLNETEMKELMEGFIENYVGYIGDTGNLYFVFGNFNKIHFVGYQKSGEEDVCIKLSGSEDCVSIEESSLSGITQTIPSLSLEGISIVTIILGNSNEYTFKLKEGENFYFVIWQKTLGGEKIVITSDDLNE
jgi:hypothetical protein